MKNEAIANMVNGLIPQFTHRASNTGLGLLPARMTSAKSILTTIGYIMKNKAMTMGIEAVGAPGE